MNFDLGEVLTRSWQISWQNKSLWWIGILLSLFIFLIFPMMLAPFSIPYLIVNDRTDFLPFILAGFVALFILFNLVVYIVSPLAQTSITLGVLKANEGEMTLPLVELLRNSLPFFWRIAGVMLLFAIASSFIVLVIQLFVLLITVITLGFGAICATPLTLLMYPAMLLTVAWQEQAINGIIVDNLGLMESIRQGWQIIRNNVLAMGLILAVVYLGIGMATSIVMMPMMIPFFILPISFIEGEPNWTLISISLLCSAAFIPLFAIVNGWSLTFTKSAMVSTYLRLTRPSNTPAVQEAAAS